MPRCSAAGAIARSSPTDPFATRRSPTPASATPPIAKDGPFAVAEVADAGANAAGTLMDCRRVGFDNASDGVGSTDSTLRCRSGSGRTAMLHRLARTA